MRRQTVAGVVAAGGSLVIIGLDQAKVDDTVQTLAEEGTAYGITADLTDRAQVERDRPRPACAPAPTTRRTGSGHAPSITILGGPDDSGVGPRHP